MSKLWIVIPAAGESRRFKEAGHNTPKPFLQIKPKNGVAFSMMTHVWHSIPNLDLSRVIVGIPSNEIVESEVVTFKLIESTKGQADTVYQLVKDLPDEDSVLVLDCDMILQTRDLSKLIELLSVYDCTIAVTETFDPNSSRVDQVPFPTVFVEKEPISQFGIVGARGFNNIGNLKIALKKTLEECEKVNKESYLSMALNNYPGTKFAHIVTEFEDWGTPQRIEESGAKIL